MAPEFPALTSLKKFTKDAGISRMTTWRFRRNGWLQTVLIAGRPYITAEALRDFVARAEAGEFAGVMSSTEANKHES